jgi:hypothetical protein
MRRLRRKDAKLDEVKAVLRRLQAFAASPQVLDPEGATHRQPRVPRPLVVAGVAATIAVFAAFGAYTLINSPRPTLVVDRGPPPAVAPGRTATDPGPKVGPKTIDASRLKDSAAGAGLQAALDLLNQGRVSAARRQLLALASENAPEVFWALARSYDPNFLRTLASPDATPNVEEATRWYRTWHAAAVKQGLIAESVSLDRIIGSMR